MAKKEINRREFITECGLKLAGASLLVNQSGAKPAFGKEKKPKPEKKKEPNMEYRTLGKTGLKVSAVSFGVEHLKEPAVLFKALDLGINYFDTAHIYEGGNSERMLGRVSKEYGREKVFIATKILPFISSQNPSERFRLFERKTLTAIMEESLKRLRTDYVDVFFAHRVADKGCLLNEDLLAFLEKLKKEGKARFVGVSLHDPKCYVDAMNQTSKVSIYDVILTWLNFTSEPEHIDILKKIRKTNVGLIAMKTQAGGYEVAPNSPLSPMQAALKWVLEKDFVDCAIPGMRNLEQLEQNVNVVGKKTGWSDRKTLHAYHNSIKYQYCLMCGKCSSTCSNTINITTINRALMYCEGYRDFELGRQTYLELSTRENGLSCISCSFPTCQCVNSIKIAERMKLAHSLFA